MPKKLMMNNVGNKALPILSLEKRTEPYNDAIEVLKFDETTVKFNIKEIEVNFDITFATFCLITYDGVGKLNLGFSNWDGGHHTRGQIPFIENKDYYVVMIKDKSNYTEFSVYLENEVIFKGRYSVQMQPKHFLHISGCYVNSFEVYNCNIKM